MVVEVGSRDTEPAPPADDASVFSDVSGLSRHWVPITVDNGEVRMVGNQREFERVVHAFPGISQADIIRQAAASGILLAVVEVRPVDPEIDRDVLTVQRAVRDVRISQGRTFAPEDQSGTGLTVAAEVALPEDEDDYEEEEQGDWGGQSSDSLSLVEDGDFADDEDAENVDDSVQDLEDAPPPATEERRDLPRPAAEPMIFGPRDGVPVVPVAVEVAAVTADGGKAGLAAGGKGGKNPGFDIGYTVEKGLKGAP